MDQEQPSGDSAAVVDTAPPTDVDSGAPSTTTDDVVNDDLPGNGEATVEDDFEEEVDGVKLRGKKEALERIKAERLMQADYTRKTQEVAAQRQAFEAERTQFQQTAQSHQQYIREVAQVVAVEERLEQFAKVNWQALTDQDPVQALKLHTEFTQLQAQRGQLVSSLTQKQQQAQHEKQRETARQLMEARQVLERDIKGWSPEMANKLVEYGRAQGYSPEILDNVTNPTFIKTLHKASLWDQHEKQLKAKAPATPAKPVTRLSGAGAVTSKDPSQMSDAEFAAWRKRQIAQRS